MKKDISTCIRIIHKDGTEEMFATVEEAAKALGLSERQLKLRATKETNTQGTTYKWCEPSTRRSYLGKQSRRKGNSWELEIIANLKKLGYVGCVSARSESKQKDNAKIDIVDTNNELPCYIQAKNTKKLPNYYNIEKECPYKDKPFVIACKQKDNPPLALVPLDFFYTLIAKM